MKIDYNDLLKIYAYILFFLFCVIFPFGQLLRVEKYIFGLYVVIHPIDLIAFLSSPFLFINNKIKHLSYIRNIIFIFTSSLVFSMILFKYFEIARGLLYLLRVIFYFSFANLIYFISENNKAKRKIVSMIFTSIIVFMLFGLIQILDFFDLRDLSYSGWDNHLYRLTSTLLDPGYSSIIFMIGIIILNKIKLNINNNLKNVLYLIFFISIILTFSRAGYLTLLIITILNLKKYIRKIFLVLFILLFIYIIFPKPKSSGVELYRISSISSRLSNYNDTLRVFINHPLFGVGFNNYCVYRTNYLNEDSTISHSCSGSDSSMFLILATTGIVGILVFINSIYKFRRILVKNEYDDTLKLIFLSVFISSLFNNSLFYNFILGLMAVFIGLTRKIKSNSDKLQKVP